MKNIYLIRHGQSEGNAKGIFTGWHDVELTDLGRKQAKELKEKLDLVKFDLIYSSDLLRALNTAKLSIGDGDIIVDEGLREKHFGDLEGLKFSEIDNKYPEVVQAWKNSDYDYPIPNGESFKAFYDRIVETYEKIKNSDGNRIIIFAHSGVIQAILAHEIVGGIQGCWRFKIENCRISEIEISDGYSFLKKINL